MINKGLLFLGKDPQRESMKRTLDPSPGSLSASKPDAEAGARGDVVATLPAVSPGCLLSQVNSSCVIIVQMQFAPTSLLG